MKRKLIIIVTFITIISACTKLDDNIYDGISDKNFPENDEQLATIPISTHSKLAPLVDDNGWWLFCQEVTADGIVFPVRGADWEDGGKWKVLHLHTWDNNTDGINKMWSTYYDGVYQANKALDFLNTFEETNELRVTKAKLLSMRALYYWFLLDNYGDVPYITTTINPPEKPLKIPRKAVFDSIVKDLESSMKYIPTGNSHPAVTKGMVATLLAKLYLNSEVYTGVAQWKKAEDYCDSVMTYGYSLEANALDPFVTENEGSPENIFTIPYDEDNFIGFRLHMRTLHYQSNKTYDMPNAPWNGCAATEAQFMLYAENDERRAGFLVGQQYDMSGQPLKDPGARDSLLIFKPYIPRLVMTSALDSVWDIRLSGVRIAKFEIKMGAKENLSNDFPIFRYADVLLMKAEAMIRQGKNGDVYVNQIRERAGIEPLTGITLEQLLEERAREMFMEGHRRIDLIRFGKFNDEWWEKPASSPDRKIFPIPQWAIDANPNLAL